MTGPSDFEDEELLWLAKIALGDAPPKDIEIRFVGRGVADRTISGLKVTGLGNIILDEARSSGRIPKTT